MSKDAPKIITDPIFSAHLYSDMEAIAVVDDYVYVKPLNKDRDWACFRYSIPTKYLIKVDAEAKEPKFKVGNVVRIKPDADKLHQGYQNGYAWSPERDNYLGRVASVKEIWCDGSIILSIRSNMMWEPIDLEPYTEPKEPTDEKEPSDIAKEVANNLSNVLEVVAMR